jgi:hypothetical protein
MRLGFAICILTQSFSSPPSFISAKLLVDLLRISISSVIFSIFRRRGPGGSQIAGGVYLTLHDEMKSEYLSYPWNTSVGDWYKKWFYIQEEPNTATLCDVDYIPKKRASWNEKPEYAGQVRELMELLPWNRLDGPVVVRSFISW